MKAKEHIWDSLEERRAVVLMGGVIEVQQERGTGIAKQIAKGVTDLGNVSKEVQIAVCMVPEVERQGYAIERAVLAVNKEIWTLAEAMNVTVPNINREVHRAGRAGAFVRHGIHFSDDVATPIGRREVAFFRQAPSNRKGRFSIECNDRPARGRIRPKELRKDAQRIRIQTAKFVT